MYKTFKKNNGFSLVEILLSGALFAIIISVLVGALIYGQESSQVAGTEFRATLLAEEGLEAVRNIRDNDFANLSNGTYGLSISGGKWTLVGVSDTTEIFNRTITISTPSTDRFQVTSNVTWSGTTQRAGSVSLVSYLNNWRKTVAVIGDWTNPNTSISTLDLSGGTTGFKIQVQGSYAYIIRSGANNFTVINISNPASPTVVGSLNLVGTLNNLAVSGNYAYVVGADNNSELQVVDITNPASPTLAGTFNAAGNADALGIYVSGSYAYMVRATSANYEFAIINITTPGSPSISGSLEFASNINDVVVSGNYAYMATSSTTSELFIADITNKSSPASLTTLNLTGTSSALAIDIYGTKLAMGSGSLLYVVDITTPSTPSQTGSVSLGGTVNDISIYSANGYAFAGTSNTANELWVVDISPVSPSTIGTFNATGNYNGVFYDSITDRLYAATATTTAELNVVGP